MGSTRIVDPSVNVLTDDVVKTERDTGLRTYRKSSMLSRMVTMTLCDRMTS